MDFIVDIFKLVAGGSFITIAGAIMVAFLKKGEFEKWGRGAGKALSKFASARFGKKTWEKIEDVITISFVSFAKGIKEGADLDDEIEEDK